MRHAVPWNVRGIDPEAREAAIEAARRSGMTPGEWLNSVISEAASDVTGSDDSFASGQPTPDRLQSIADRLERATRKASSTALPTSRLGSDDRDIVRALDAVARLAELSERRSAAAIEAIEGIRSTAKPGRALDDMAGAVRAMETAPPAERASGDPLEASIAEIAARKRALAARLAPPVPVEHPRSRTEPAERVADLAPLAARIDDLGRQIDRLSGERQRPVEERSHVVAELQALSQRIDAINKARPFDSGREAGAQAGEFAHMRGQERAPAREILTEIRDLGRRIEGLRPDHGGLEREIAGLADQIAQMRADQLAPLDVVHGLAQRLDEKESRRGGHIDKELKILSARIEMMRDEIAARPSESLTPTVAALRADLATLSRDVAGLAPRTAVERLGDDIRMLADRLADVRENGHGTAPLEQFAADLQRSIATMRPAEGVSEALRSISTKLDAIKPGAESPSQVKRLVDDMAELKQRLAGMATRDAVETIANNVSLLSERIDALAIARAPDGTEALVGAIEQRIVDIADRIEGRALQVLERSVPPGTHDLDLTLRRLIAKLEESQARGHDSRSIADLERHVLALAQRLDGSEGPFAQLGAIERGLSDLFVQMADMREASLDAVERAARQASAGAQGGHPDATQIRREIDELKAANEAANRRADGTLDVVHQTLERVARRIAAIEQSPEPAPPQPPRPEAEARPPVAPPAPARVSIDPPPPARMTAEPMPAPARPPTVEPAKAVPAARAPDASDMPIEPGSGAPSRVRPPSAGGAAGSKTEFIAAARRAAQTAAAEAEAEAQRQAAAPASERASSLFSRLKGAVSRQEAAAPAGQAQPPLSPKPMAAPSPPPAPKKLPEAARRMPKPKVDEPIEPAARPLPVGKLKSSKSSLLRKDQGGLEAYRKTIVLGLAAALLIVAAGVSTWAAMRMRPPAVETARPAQTSAPTPPPRAGMFPTNTQSAPRPPSAPTPGIPRPQLGPVSEAPQTTDPVTTASVAPQAADPITTGSVAPDAARRVAPLPGTVISPTGWQPAVPAAPAGQARPSSIPQPLRQAAQAGNPQAAFELATRHLEGRGTPVDLAEAARLYRVAAGAGLVPAQFRLASMMEKGQGTARDLPGARTLYEQAAVGGSAKAMHNLAVLFAQGALSERPDYRTAAIWFRRAAEHGMADSQYNLAILHARGLGVDQSLAESYKWFALAANGGDRDSATRRDEVAGRLDAQTLVAARLAVETFQARPEPESANVVPAPAGGWGDEPRSAQRRPDRPAQGAPAAR